MLSTIRARGGAPSLKYIGWSLSRSYGSLLPQKGDLKGYIVSRYTEPTTHFDVELPGWRRLLGENVISLFNIDMDKVRSGPIGGFVFRDLCKHQGYFTITKGGVVTAEEPKKLSPKRQSTDEAPIVVSPPISENSRFYYNTLGLPQTFQQWYQISTLHMWMLFVRMRAMPRKYCREYQRKLVNGVFDDISVRLTRDVQITSERQINTYKKQFHDQLRGAVFSYDEGLYTNDAVLAAALWRNLFSGKKDIDMSYLEQLVHYVRTQMYLFDRISDRDFATGRFGFIDPWKRYEPLSEEDLNEIRSIAQSRVQELEFRALKPSERSRLSTEFGW